MYGSSEPDFGMEGVYPKSNWFNDKDMGSYILTNDPDEDNEKTLMKNYLRDRFLLDSDSSEKININDVRETLENQTKTFTQPAIEEFIKELLEAARELGLDSDSDSDHSVDSALDEAFDMDDMLNLSSNINVISEDNLEFHTGQRYKTTADRHILLPTSFDPVDIHDFFDNKLSGPYTIIYTEHTKKEDSGSTTQVNSLLFSKSLSLIDGDDNIHSVSFNSDEDKQNRKE